MNWVFISIIAVTVGQWATCGFSFALLLSIIGRLIFLARLVGSVVPIKTVTAFEAADLFFVLLGLIFTKAPINWVETILTIGFCAITWLLYIIDDRFYLYVVEDDEEE